MRRVVAGGAFMIFIDIITVRPAIILIIVFLFAGGSVVVVVAVIIVVVVAMAVIIVVIVVALVQWTLQVSNLFIFLLELLLEVGNGVGQRLKISSIGCCCCCQVEERFRRLRQFCFGDRMCAEPSLDRILFVFALIRLCLEEECLEIFPSLVCGILAFPFLAFILVDTSLVD